MYDGENCHVQEILRYDTGNDVVMNFAVHNINSFSYLAAGQEGQCHLYKLKCCVSSEEIGDAREKSSSNLLSS